MQRSVPWPVVVLLCVGVWAVTRTCSETHTPEPRAEATPTVAPARPPVPSRRAAGPSDAGHETPDAARGAVPAGAESTAEIAAAEWLAVEIVVLSADGRPVEDADVHALPAGAPGTDDRSAVSWATTNESGRATLALPGPGPWDFAAVSGSLIARANDVTPQRGVPLELQLEREAVLEIILDASLAGRAAAGYGPPFKLRRETEPEILERLFPGRADVPATRLPWGPLADEAPVAARVPEGVPFRIRAENGYDAAPRVASAPGRVFIRRDERPSLAWRIEPSTATPPSRASRAVVDIAWIRAADSFAQKMVILAGGDNPPQGTQPGATVRFDADESGTVIWYGPGIERGQTKWSMSALGAEPLILPVVVKEWEPSEEPKTSVVRARFEGVGAGERVEWYVDGADGENWGGWSPGDPPSSLSSGLVPLTVHGMTPWRVAREVRLDAAAEHDVTLKFEPAGRVSVALDGPPPETVSGVFVRRADRAPLAHIDDASPSHSPSLNCAGGALLGPFLPGDVDLEFVAAGVVVARRKVTVVAGRTVPLVVAVSAPR